MVATKRKIYVFLPYRSFGNSCEYIYAGVAAAQSTNKKLIIIVPSLLRFLYIKKENREFERLASEFISKDLFVSSVFQNMFFLYECVRYLANKMIFKHIGFDWYFPVAFCSKIFSIIDFSRLDRTQCVVRYCKTPQKFSDNNNGRMSDVVIHFRVDASMDRGVTAVDPYLTLAKKINRQGRRVIFLGVANQVIANFCNKTENLNLLPSSGSFTQSTFTFFEHCAYAVCSTSGPLFAAFLFGKPVLTLNATNLLVPQKENDLTLLKSFERSSGKLSFQDYCDGLSELQCVDDSWQQSYCLKDNTENEVLSAHAAFLELNSFEEKCSLGQDYLPSEYVNMKPLIASGVFNRHFDHIYGHHRRTGGKYWHDRLKFNCAVDQKIFHLVEWY